LDETIFGMAFERLELFVELLFLFVVSLEVYRVLTLVFFLLFLLRGLLEVEAIFTGLMTALF
jgi:hypothetical protein